MRFHNLPYRLDRLLFVADCSARYQLDEISTLADGLWYILRTVVNYDFSLALNIASCVAQACNSTLLLLAFAPCSRCPWLTQNFPTYNRSKYKLL